MTDPDRILEHLRPPRTAPSIVCFTALAVASSGAGVTFTSEWLDGGVNIWGPVKTHLTVTAGKELLVTRDELEQFWIIGVR